MKHVHKGVIIIGVFVGIPIVGFLFYKMQFGEPNLISDTVGSSNSLIEDIDNQTLLRLTAQIIKDSEDIQEKNDAALLNAEALFELGDFKESVEYLLRSANENDPDSIYVVYKTVQAAWYINIISNDQLVRDPQEIFTWVTLLANMYPDLLKPITKTDIFIDEWFVRIVENQQQRHPSNVLRIWTDSFKHLAQVHLMIDEYEQNKIDPRQYDISVLESQARQNLYEIVGFTSRQDRLSVEMITRALYNYVRLYSNLYEHKWGSFEKMKDTSDFALSYYQQIFKQNNSRGSGFRGLASMRILCTLFDENESESDLQKFNYSPEEAETLLGYVTDLDEEDSRTAQVFLQEALGDVTSPCYAPYNYLSEQNSEFKNWLFK